jgi:hypothetical protein
MEPHTAAMNSAKPMPSMMNVMSFIFLLPVVGGEPKLPGVDYAASWSIVKKFSQNETPSFLNKMPKSPVGPPSCITPPTSSHPRLIKVAFAAFILIANTFISIAFVIFFSRLFAGQLDRESVINVLSKRYKHKMHTNKK